MRGAGTLGLVACLLLSACAGQGLPTGGDPSGVDDPSHPASFSTGQDSGVTGGIRVLALDESLLPLANVSVAVRGLDAVLLTGPDGAAEFLGLEPGQHIVDVQRIGFEAEARAVDVEAGEITEVALTLRPFATAAPFHRTRIFKGFISCGISLVTSANFNCTGNERMRYDFRVAYDLMSIVDEVTWQKNNALGADRLRLWLAQNETTVGTISFKCSYAIVHGSSPIYVLRNRPFECLNSNDPVDGGGLMTSWVRTPLELTTVAIIIEQPFLMYVTEFYGAPAPDGFSARPDQ